jgi:hypothetical protein
MLQMTIAFFVNRAIDGLLNTFRLILREFELFLGAALFIVGFFGFNSDKYCDGNTADYLSCTRPSTFYYFDWIDITLIVLGVFFMLAWHLKRRYS